MPKDERSDLLRCLLLHSWQHVGVGLKRDRDVRVTETFLDDFRVNTCL